MRYGMNDKLGLVAYDEERRNLLAGTPPPPTERRYSEATAREIDCAVREALDRAFEAATGTLTRAQALLERGAKLLLEKETLTEPELQSLRRELLAALAPEHSVSLPSR